MQVSAQQPLSDTDQDLDKLIEKTEIEGEEENITSEPGLKFNFAKVWTAEKDTLEDIGDSVPDIDHGDSWAQALERMAAEKMAAKEKEVTGRGVRRKAAAAFPAVCPQDLHRALSLIHTFLRSNSSTSWMVRKKLPPRLKAKAKRRVADH